MSDTPALSIRLEVLPGDTVAEQVAFAADCGFDAIALPGRFRDRWESSLRERANDLPLPLASLSLGFQGSLLAPDAATRRACRDSLLELFDLCADLGIPRFNMPPCLIQDNPVRISDPGEHATVTDRLEEMLLEQLPGLADEAEARGVTVLLEPVNAYESEFLNSIEDAGRLTRHVFHPALQCTADFFHMQLEELDTAQALADNLDQIFHVHVAENTRVEPGPGSLDFRPGFAVLKKGGYRQVIEVECRRLSGPAEPVLRNSAAYLRRVWQDAA